MQVILTASDLAAMPTALRQELVDYIATRRKAGSSGPGRHRAGEGAEDEDLVVLDREQAITLIRNLSFGREQKSLHDLLEVLAYEKESDAPNTEQLARSLRLDDTRRLRRYFDAIKLLQGRLGLGVAPLARYSRRSRAYLVHPITRATLREVFAQLAQSGEGEEPPWV